MLIYVDQNNSKRFARDLNLFSSVADRIRIWLFTLMRIQIQIRLLTLMRIRIQHLTLMRSRI